MDEFLPKLALSGADIRYERNNELQPNDVIRKQSPTEVQSGADIRGQSLNELQPSTAIHEQRLTELQPVRFVQAKEIKQELATLE